MLTIHLQNYKNFLIKIRSNLIDYPNYVFIVFLFSIIVIAGTGLIHTLFDATFGCEAILHGY